MIERLLAAEAALAEGDAEVARRLYAQVAEADPRNAIAVVGLARLAARDGRPEEAQALVERALAIDPDEAAALRLIRELAVSTIRGGTPPPVASPQASPRPAVAEPIEVLPEAPREAMPELLPEAREPAPEPAASAPTPNRRSLLDRIRAWLSGRGARS